MKPKKENEWADLLGSLLKSRENTPKGPGWSTARDLAKDLELTEHAMKRRLARLSSEGLVEIFKGTSVFNGRISNQVWYRIKKGKK